MLKPHLKIVVNYVTSVSRAVDFCQLCFSIGFRYFIIIERWIFFFDKESHFVARLECSGEISAHCDSLVQAILRVAGITGARLCALLIFVFLVETGFHQVGQDGLDLLTS